MSVKPFFTSGFVSYTILFTTFFSFSALAVTLSVLLVMKYTRGFTKLDNYQYLYPAPLRSVRRLRALEPIALVSLTCCCVLCPFCAPQIDPHWSCSTVPDLLTCLPVAHYFPIFPLEFCKFSTKCQDATFIYPALDFMWGSWSWSSLEALLQELPLPLFFSPGILTGPVTCLTSPALSLPLFHCSSPCFSSELLLISPPGQWLTFCCV